MAAILPSAMATSPGNSASLVTSVPFLTIRSRRAFAMRDSVPPCASASLLGRASAAIGGPALDLRRRLRLPGRSAVWPPPIRAMYTLPGSLEASGMGVAEPSAVIEYEHIWKLFRSGGREVVAL